MYEAGKTAQIEREMQKYNIQILGKRKMNSALCATWHEEDR
jgi:hypothetical protein